MWRVFKLKWTWTYIDYLMAFFILSCVTCPIKYIEVSTSFIQHHLMTSMLSNWNCHLLSFRVQELDWWAHFECYVNYSFSRTMVSSRVIMHIRSSLLPLHLCNSRPSTMASLHSSAKRQPEIFLLLPPSQFQNIHSSQQHKLPMLHQLNHHLPMREEECSVGEKSTRI